VRDLFTFSSYNKNVQNSIKKYVNVKKKEKKNWAQPGFEPATKEKKKDPNVLFVDIINIRFLQNCKHFEADT
jgi:hypothetical protein